MKVVFEWVGGSASVNLWSNVPMEDAFNWAASKLFGDGMRFEDGKLIKKNAKRAWKTNVSARIE